MLTHLSPFSENRGNEGKNSSLGGKWRYKRRQEIKEQERFVLLPLLFFSHCGTQPHSSRLSSGDIRLNCISKDYFWSQVLGIPVALFLASLSPLMRPAQQLKKVKGRVGCSLASPLEERSNEQLWSIPMALCWLGDSHPIKRVGHGVQFINFGGGGRLTGLVLTWIMMDHQEMQLNQTQRVSPGSNVGQVLSSQSDPISI